ncbi:MULTISPECIES: hypothetical protein [Nocardia]|uniref:hypothetical protein n=1 Tax=Nocardia TaxID=1817 RepID=UPI0012F685B3|nr:hypothetical protein [Nocardia araoensis]
MSHSNEEADAATSMTALRCRGHPGGSIYGCDQDATRGCLSCNSEREPHFAGLHPAGSWAGIGGFQRTLEPEARVARRLLRTETS